VLVPPFYADGQGTTPEMTLLDCDNADCDTAMAQWANLTRAMCPSQLLTSGNAGPQPRAVFAGTDRPVAAVMPYHWSSLNNGVGQRSLGGKELPKARAAWEDFGNEVLKQHLVAQ
jgi:hypothetical protein